MKYFLLTNLFICSIFLKAQEHPCSKVKQSSLANTFHAQAKTASSSAQISHEIKYDVNFVYLNLNLERTNKFISGGVTTIAKVSAPVLDTFMTLLHTNHTIDSIRFNGAL